MRPTTILTRLIRRDPDPAGRGLGAPAQAVIDRVLIEPEDRTRFDRVRAAPVRPAGLADYVIAEPGQSADPLEVFDRLHWGGQFIYITPRIRDAEHVIARFRARPEYLIDSPIQSITRPRAGFRLHGLTTDSHFFVARKIALVRSDQWSDRYTYDVRLAPDPTRFGQCIVLKQVPTYEGAVARLAGRYPSADRALIEKGARKLVDKVFPIFLTREAAFLKILQSRLPQTLSCRVPTVIDLQKDDRGFVRAMALNWLRLGGPAMSQLEFARQSATLLQALHEKIGVIHMDLRLDNFVVTEHGVGFVDFGSAACLDEDFADSPMLRTLFNEMLSTSQIQRDLARFRDKGRVTSRLLLDSYQKIDKAIDLFYLTLQINNPHINPDFQDVVDYDPRGEHARQLARISRKLLRPEDPSRPEVKSVRDLVERLERVG
ncbi:MAG: hypothetical protein CMJ18_04240 [Phycisphaeraceae bacterium]|nr:hypothetical protein [Phycisphaeraceae bacterium]